MKKVIYLAIIFALAVLFSTSACYAGNGNGGNGNNGSKGSQGNGTCTLTDLAGISPGILEGEPFEYEGTVASIGFGQGMVIATADGTVTVYGIGPVRYWNKLDVDRPVAGDVVSVSGYTVTFLGAERNIAMSITIDGTTVQLRDPDTAKPLWVGARYGNGWGRK